MKFWMIANIEDLCICPDRLSPSRAPRYIHLDREEAEKELLRLAGKCHHGEFVLLEAVAWAGQIPGYPEHYRVEPIA